MAPDCSNPNRRRLIQYLSSEATAETSLNLLEFAVKGANVELIKNSVSMLQKALSKSSRENDQAPGYYAAESRESLADAFKLLIKKDAWNTNLTMTEKGSYIKTTANVLAKGTPLLVKSGQCTIEDCPACIFENICQREETQQILEQNKALLQDIKNSLEAKSTRQRPESLTGTQALIDSVSRMKKDLLKKMDAHDDAVRRRRNRVAF